MGNSLEGSSVSNPRSSCAPLTARGNQSPQARSTSFFHLKLTSKLDSQVTFMTASPDGSSLAYIQQTSNCNRLVIRGESTGQTEEVIREHLLFQKEIGSLKFSKDSRRVILSYKGSSEVYFYGLDGSEQTWLMDTIHSYTTHSSDYYQFFFNSNNDDQLVCFGQHALIIDAKSHKCRESKWFRNDLTIAAFSHSGSKVALTMENSNTIKLWDLTTNAVFDISPSFSDINHLSFTPEDDTLVISYKFHHVLESYDLDTKKLERITSVKSRSHDVCYPVKSTFDCKFRYAMTASCDMIKMWSVGTQHLELSARLLDVKEGDYIIDYAFSVENHHIWVKTSGNHLYEFELIKESL